jgi:ZF-HD class homeobox domain-containing protein
VAVTEAGATKPAAVKKGMVRYRECQKNHAASIGGHAIDGCGEFMPGGEDGSADALRCAACDCHRNFHRREVEGEPLCDCKRNKPTKALPGTTTPVTTTLALPSTTAPLSMTPLTMAALSAGGPTDSDEPDDAPGNSGGGGMMMSMRSPSTIKKRFRTKFTTEQKDQMCAFAEKVGWRIQKHDEAAVQEFCSTVGVKRHVLKVWMHNNKHTMGKKP